MRCGPPIFRFLVACLLAQSCSFDSPECLRDTDCTADTVCSQGICVLVVHVCDADDDCFADERCVAGTCMFPGRCTHDIHCDPMEQCETGLCQPMRCSEGECPAGFECRDGQCVLLGCTTDQDCTVGYVCDALDGVCKPPSTIPGPETCNGIDDDLDGEADEGYGVGEICTVGDGTCEIVGVIMCSEDGGSDCSAQAGLPSLEKCNGLDDDCDSKTDEDFPDLGVACTYGLGECAVSGERFCAATGTETICVPDEPPPEPSPETCNDLDDDCDGLVDEDFLQLDNPCVGGVEPCTFEGWWRCENGDVECLPGLDPYPLPDDCR